MSEVDREKWDQRYREGSYQARTHPTALLEAWLPRLPRGRALDVACGAGRNALFLAAAGYEVDAIDISSAALARAREKASQSGLDVDWIEADLDTDPLPDKSYELIVVARYSAAALMPHLISRLSEGGHLLYEQHLLTHRDVVGPSSAGFRMQPNELLTLAAGLRVLYYAEGLVEDPDGRTTALAQLVACKGSPGF